MGVKLSATLIRNQVLLNFNGVIIKPQVKVVNNCRHIQNCVKYSCNPTAMSRKQNVTCSFLAAIREIN